MITIHCSQLSKRYGKRTILQDLSLSLTSGQCVLLTGANGSGKTTLMRILAGLEKPEQGSIQINTQAQQTWPQARPSLLRQVMYLHQQPYLFEGDVYHNLAFALPRGLDKTAQGQRIMEVATWAGLDHVLHNNAKHLSGGEAQRTAIARALLRQPSAILLDEPTANMDFAARQLTVNMVQQLLQQDMAVLVSSHDPAWFDALAHTHLRLNSSQ